jgi:hypothetical protein
MLGWGWLSVAAMADGCRTHLNQQLQRKRQRVSTPRPPSPLISHRAPLPAFLSASSPASPSPRLPRPPAGKCVVLKTSTRQTIFLPVVGLVDAAELKPGDLVGVNKVSCAGAVVDPLQPPPHNCHLKFTQESHTRTLHTPTTRANDTQHTQHTRINHPAGLVPRPGHAARRVRLKGQGDGGGREADGGLLGHRRAGQAGGRAFLILVKACLCSACVCRARV